MKKLFSFVLIFVLIFALVGCGSSAVLDADHAVAKLEDHLIVTHLIQDGLQLEDGQQMEWDKESITEMKIEENDCYAVTLCFASVPEFAEGGDMVDGRRFASFAVSKDGQHFYKDNPAANVAADVWEAI